MKVLITVLVATAALLLLVGNANASSGNPKPPVISPTDTLPAGAVVQQGTPVSPSVVEAATGATAADLGMTSVVSTAGALTCWFQTASKKWGIGDLSVSLSDRTYWCGYYNGNLTYRSTNVVPYSLVCSHNNTGQQRIAGAANNTAYYVEWYDYSTFACPVPYIGINFYESIALYATSYGKYVMYWTT